MHGRASLVYIATWSGWLVNAREYEEHLSATQYRQYTGHGHCAEDDDSYIATDLDESKHWPTADEKDASGIGEAWQSLRSLWYYHQDVYTFHTHFLNCCHAHLRVQAVELAAASTARSGSRSPTTSSRPIATPGDNKDLRATRAATRPRAATASGRCC